LTGAAEQQIFLTMTNKVTALDAAMTLLFHIGRHRRGASEFQRYV